MGPLVIDDLLPLVPQGEERLFPRQIVGASEDRFFAVYNNHEYPRHLRWHNTLPLEQMPWAGSREKDRIPITVLPPPLVTFGGNSNAMVDFYADGGPQVFFISNKLRKLIEDADPGSLDHRPMMIKARDSAVDFNLIMPARNVDAVDPQRTDIVIKDEKLANLWFRKVQFSNGVVFREATLREIQNFSDRNVQGWFWSRELIDAAKAAGIRGVVTNLAGMIAGPTIDRF